MSKIIKNEYFNEVSKEQLDVKIIKSKLRVGEKLFYKEICNRLKLPYYAGGAQKIAQVKELRRFLKFEINKKKWEILEIYDTPEEKVPRAVPNNAIYVRNIENIILNYLSSIENNEAYITKNNLWVLLGMVNPKYLSVKNDVYNFINQYSDINLFELDNFYTRSISYFSKILESSLRSLKRRSLITYSEVYMIVTNNETNQESQHKANVAETEEIIRIRKDLLLKYEIYDEYQLLYKNIKFKEKFYRELNEIYKEQNNWDKIYKCFHIIYNKENVLRAIADDQIKRHKEIINTHIIGKLNTQAANNVLTQDPEKFIYPENYIKIQEQLAEELIRIA